MRSRWIRGLLFAVAAGIATAVLCGLVPALRASRADVTEALRAVGRSSGGSPAAAGFAAPSSSPRLPCRAFCSSAAA